MFGRVCLCMAWTGRACVGHVLDMCQTCFKRVWDKRWSCVGHVLDMSWICFRHDSGMFLACFRNVLDLAIAVSFSLSLSLYLPSHLHTLPVNLVSDFVGVRYSETCSVLLWGLDPMFNGARHVHLQAQAPGVIHGKRTRADDYAGRRKWAWRHTVAKRI